MTDKKFQELCIEKIVEYHNSKISDVEKASSEKEELKNITNELKTLAEIKDTPVITAQQLNRTTVHKDVTKLKPSMIYSIYMVNATIMRRALFATTLISGRYYELTYTEFNNELRLNVYNMTDVAKFKL